MTDNGQRQGEAFYRGELNDWPEEVAKAYIAAGQARAIDKKTARRGAKRVETAAMPAKESR